MKREINFDWCKEHGLKKKTVNAASYVTYYYEREGEYVISYTKCSNGKQVIGIWKYSEGESVEFECKNRKSITESMLFGMCSLVNIEYPF